jgi:hypothetical protein
MGGGTGLKSHMSREKNMAKKAAEKSGELLFVFMFVYYSS